MAGRKRWLSTESEEKLNKAIELYVSRWSELNNALDVYRRLRKAKFSSHVFDFFTSTSVPTVDDLARKLFGSLFILNATIDLRCCREPAARLLNMYHGYLAAQGLKPVHISSESVLTFKQIMDSVLSEWSELQSVSERLGDLRRDDIATTLFFFFSETADPNVDSLAEEIHRVIRNTLDGLVDLNDCKKAAQQMLKIHQSFLDESGGKSVARHELVSSA